MYHKNSSAPGAAPPSSAYTAYRSTNFVPRPVYPYYTESMMDLSNRTLGDYMLSTVTSCDNLSTINTSRAAVPNAGHRTMSLSGGVPAAANQSRFKDRLAASTAGLKELDALREKHRRMIQEVKCRITNFNASCLELDGTKTDREYDQQQQRLPSPAPSANEMSSNMSYRSSLSMDSGCLSMNSDHQLAHHNSANTFVAYSTSLDCCSGGGGGASLPPSRKCSSTTAAATTAIAVDCSDDEGCYPDAPTPQLSQSCASIPNLAVATATASVAEAPPKPPFRYRRRGLQPPPRPRSLYSYPEENTVTVGQESSSNYSPSSATSSMMNGVGAATDRVYRASKIFVSPRSPQGSNQYFGANNSSLSMLSIPSCLRYAGRSSRPGSMALPNNYHLPGMLLDNGGDCYHGNRTVNRRVTVEPVHNTVADSALSSATMFTWEQVKRLLDPEFASRGNVGAFRRYSQSPSEITIGSQSQRNLSSEECCHGNRNRQASTQHVQSATTVCSQEHVMISRSVSSQSSDSSKSRKREKTWHESERL